MFFRFKLTWIWLFLSIALSYVIGNYQPVIEESPQIFTSAIPYEKFIEGDVIEPFLYGQYSIIENVSPFIPVNPLLEKVLPALNPYQTPANSYETAKPMPTNFNIYNAKNPTPVQYKPAPPIYGQPPVAPLSYNNYAPPPPPPPLPVSYPISYPALPSPIFTQPQPDVSYGLHYEQNPGFQIPTPSYPTSPVPYTVPPPPPALPPLAPPNPYVVPPPLPYPALPVQPNYASAIPYPPAVQPYVPPVVYYDKPEESKSNETEKLAALIEIKKDDLLAEAKSTIPLSISNETPLAKSISGKTSAEKSSTISDKSMKPLTDSATQTSSAQSAVTKSVAKSLTSNLTAVPPKQQRYVGYRYIQQADRRRSAPSNANAQELALKNYQQQYQQQYQQYQQQYQQYQQQYQQQQQIYRRSLSNTVQPKSNLHLPTPDSANKTTTDSKKRTTYQYRTINKEAPKNVRGSSYNYAPKPFYPAASTAYQQTSIYNENNVAESILRGFSVNPEDNNNKGIVRIFEESPSAIYFDFRVCDLKKDHLYSIYIHDYGQLTAGCESTGGQFGSRETYFNPMLGLKSNPSGFLGSFKFNGENLNIQHFTKKLTLSLIVGRSIVIHEVTTNQKVLPEALENNMLNTFTMLMNPLSSPLISSKRIACGVIGRANPYAFLRPPNQNCEIEVPVIEENISAAKDLPATRRDTKVDEIDPK